MKFKFILIFFIFTNIFAQDNLDLPENFLKRFFEFKAYYLKKDAKNLYEMQMPHFKYLNGYEDFSLYVDRIKEAKVLNISKILEKNDDMIKISISFQLKESENLVYSTQEWYLINGQYYLLTDVMLLFKI